MAGIPPAFAPSPEPVEGSEGERAPAVVVLVLAACAAYATSFLGGFQFDDWRVIVDDPRVQSVPAWWSSMPGIRPLLKLSYAWNQGSGMGLPGFHAANLAVHAASTALAFLLLARLGRRLARPGRRDLPDHGKLGLRRVRC